MTQLINRSSFQWDADEQKEKETTHSYIKLMIVFSPNWPTKILIYNFYVWFLCFFYFMKKKMYFLIVVEDILLKLSFWRCIKSPFPRNQFRCQRKYWFKDNWREGKQINKQKCRTNAKILRKKTFKDVVKIVYFYEREKTLRIAEWKKNSRRYSSSHMQKKTRRRHKIKDP